MALFKKGPAPDTEVPSLSKCRMPDPKWTRRHLHDVETIIQAARLYMDREQVRADGATLATTLMSAGPSDCVIPQAGRVEQALAAAASLGHAFAALHSRPRTPPEIYDALQWAAYMAVPNEPSVMAALIFGCHAGYYVGRHMDNGLDDVRRNFSWEEALRLSPQVAGMREVITVGWRAIGGASL
ncbi:MAG TPA: hypothetical protein VM142_07620 [Acidimicrobiales bacterium]|nr:hypothetical protein [Acidimicrobiales bacterium]